MSDRLRDLLIKHEGVRLRDLAWAAGFLDGEGCFFRHCKGREARGLGYTVALEAAQVQKWPLELLHTMFGGSLSIYHQRSKQGEYWKWRVYGPRAAGIMMTLYCLLSPKRQSEIMATVKPWRNKPPHSRYKLECVNGHAFDAINTRHVSYSHQRRICKQCARDAQARYRERKRGADE